MRIFVTTLALLLAAFPAGAQPYNGIQVDDAREAPVPFQKAQPDAARKTEAPARTTADGDYIAPVRGLEREENGIPYATGGVGEEEAETLASLESEYNLHILATAANGEFVSFYMVTITKDGEPVLSARAEGPRFLVKLEPGKYRVDATYRDADAKPQYVTVPKTGRREARFRW